MLLIALAAAAQLSAPVPMNLNKWFYPDDMPQSVTKRGNGLWFVGVRLNVAPNGALKGCKIESTSGIPDLDNATCRLLLRRAKFQPARWFDGTDVNGAYRTSVMWAVSDVPWDTSNVAAGDMEISVDHLPAGIKSPAVVSVMFAVDLMGRASSCMAESSGGLQHVQNDPELVTIACDQLLKAYRPTPAKDSNGTPVASVQDGTVVFKIAHH